MKIFKILLLISTILIFTNAYSAEFDPTKNPIEIVVGYPPGGSQDIVGRIVLKIFEKHGWKGIVVNKVGGDASIAARYVATAAPNGQTLLIAGVVPLGTNIADPYKNLSYQYSDFDHITLISKTSLVLYANPSLGIKNYADYERWVKQHPKDYTVGVFAAYATVLLKDVNNRSQMPAPLIVPYKGSNDLIAGILSNTINFTVDSYAANKELIAVGKIVPIAVFDRHPPATLSKVKILPNQDPSGEFYMWTGIVAPAGTPPNVVKKINQVINIGLKDPQIKKIINESGFETFGGSIEEFQDLNTQTITKFRFLFNKNS